MRLLIAAAALAALLVSPARAEVVSASPGAFFIQAETEVPVPPEEAWRALTSLNRWWNSTHTYSGDARRLSLEARAGGCWCERWDGQSVEHARVVLVMEREGVRTLRAVGGLGPLQDMGAIGVMTFTVAPHASGAKITMTYRVAGEPGLNLEPLAPLVDQVLVEQIGRLSRYTASGSPDE
ncbi:MAG: SRPBCC family protein [Phycisphaerales bacterium]|nr:SRPBCC family protein [Hyphomonadaceae bacterium]